MRLFGPRYPERRQVVVNCKDDQAFRGLLWEMGERFLLLRDASLLPPKEEAIPIDGELVLDRSAVSFLQVLPE